MEPQPPAEDTATGSPGEAPSEPVTDARPAPLPWEHTVEAAPIVTIEPQDVDQAAEVPWIQAEDHARDVPGAPGLIYAGVLPRSLAWFVDGFIIAVLSLVILGVLIA